MYLCCLLTLCDIIIFLLLWRDICAESAVNPKQTNKQDLVFNSVDRDVKKAWWDCVKNDRESLALSQKDGQSRNKWRRRIKGATG